MVYFIDATDRIIKEEGLEAVTIRRVSESAGYTSATLYNYFDNLNHLIFLTAMSYLVPYSREVLDTVKDITDPTEVYLVVTSIFVKHGFMHPDIFEILFYKNRNERLEDYVQQYFELFPGRMPKGFDLLSRAARFNNLTERNAVYLVPCVEQGYLTQRAADELKDLTKMVFRHYLEEVRLGYMDSDAAHRKCDFYFRRLMEMLKQTSAAALGAESDAEAGKESDVEI
jgi:AcrR family transcriptional regulator